MTIPTTPVLGENGRSGRAALAELAAKRRLYTLFGLGLFCFVAVSGSLWFANETNSGKFFDRLPYFFDFVEDLLPRDGMEIFRALFDLPSPYDDGSMKYNYPEGRLYITETLYIPEYILQDGRDGQHRHPVDPDRPADRLLPVRFSPPAT